MNGEQDYQEYMDDVAEEEFRDYIVGEEAYSESLHNKLDRLIRENEYLRNEVARLDIGRGGYKWWRTEDDELPPEDTEAVFVLKVEPDNIRKGYIYPDLGWPFEDEDDGYAIGEILFWLPLPELPENHP